jgi:flagellin-specific chaperone FliS
MDISFNNAALWIIIAFVLLFILYMLRSYFSALMSSLFYDYVIDGALSFADNFIAGIGLTGLDIGDAIAGIIIFMRYYKQLGWQWALICGLEAANFFFSFIPVIGEPIEWFFNFFPIISIIVMIKQYHANSTYTSIKGYYDFIAEEDSAAAEKWKGAVDKIKQYFESLNYTDMKKEGTGIEEGLHAEVGKIIMKKLNTAQKYLIEQLENNASKEDIDAIKSAIERAQQDIETDWRTAAAEANSILQSVSSLVYRTQQPAEEFKEAA